MLWVAKGLGPGGMEQLLVSHAEGGDRARIEYSAACLVERPNSVVGRLRAQGVECRTLGGRHPADPRWVRSLDELVRRERIDVVHIHSPFVAALARPALRARRGGPALVYTEHNSADCYKVPTRWGNWATYPLDDARLAVSTAARESTPSVLRRRTEVLVHGVDVAGIAALRAERDEVRSELGVGPDDVLIGIVANLRRAKAYPVLLDAARSVVDRFPDRRAVFVSLGQGPLHDELETRRVALGLGDGFRFLGFRADVRRVMAGFDVFTLSSDVEGLPVSLMEAKALGLPAVVTAVGGVPEMVADGEDGLLVPRRDPARLADALATLVADDELRARLGRGSAASASRYDASLAIRRQDELYLELARRRDRS